MTRPIWLAYGSVNQILPSGPAVIPVGLLERVTGVKVAVPVGVMRPTWSRSGTVNQRLPSGPVVMPQDAPPQDLPPFQSLAGPSLLRSACSALPSCQVMPCVPARNRRTPCPAPGTRQSPRRPTHEKTKHQKSQPGPSPKTVYRAPLLFNDSRSPCFFFSRIARGSYSLK